MASAGLGKELECSICLSLYTDPVTLRCGHNFCRDCIDQVLSTQDGSRVYSCPECREEFRERPGLQRNITLRNVVENFLSTQPPQEETKIFCTYCVDSPVPAVKSCLQCEASLCDKHLRVHSKGPEHVLTDPSTSLENRKCSVHKKILEYYCTEDAACICVSCSLAGEHRGHQVEILEEASEKKKMKLRNVLQKLITKREETEEKVRSLEERWRKAQEKASGEIERVTALFIDLRRRLDDLEKKILSEISRQEMKMSLSMSVLIQKLEIKKDELSRKMKDIEELCNMTDPLTVLQEPDTGDLCDPEEGGGDEDTGGHDGGDGDTEGHDGGDEDTEGHDGGDGDTGGHDGGDGDTGGHDGGDGDLEGYQGVDLILHNSRTLSDIIRGVNGSFYIQAPANIILDINTANNNLIISDDLKTATWTRISQNRPETAERYKNYQVMSSRGFTSGRHYWDVEMSGKGIWSMGMCYPTTVRTGYNAGIGHNKHSWGLCREWVGNRCSVLNGDSEIKVHHQISSERVRIYVDYEAGELSFYELCDPIRHLHTFTTTFTEPLHAVLCVWSASIKIKGELKPKPYVLSRPQTMKCTILHCEQAYTYLLPEMEHRSHSASFSVESAMASTDVKVLCYICVNPSTDPVTLRCGHNFCRVCIDQVLTTQDGSRVYSCPECREEFRERPTLQRNITLRNVVENFCSTKPPQEETKIFCTYCIHSPVPAVKSCLHCEASLCDDHLRVHSKGPEHVLTDPSTSLENKKCKVHKELYKYYCTKDDICICVTCSLAGEHQGHQVETLDEASEKKKKKLRDVLQELTRKRDQTKGRVQSLEEQRRKAQEKASGEAERVTALFIDLRKRLDDLEKRILKEISSHEEQVSLSLTNVIQKLEIKKDELSRKMKDIEELCNMTDPLTVLQEPDTGDLCDPEEGGGDGDTGGHGGDEDTGGHDGGDRGVELISQISHTLSDIMRDLNVSFYVQDPVDILLDINTAANNLLVSDDLKTAMWTHMTQNYPETAERFQEDQVMSLRHIISGRHYCDVEVQGSSRWSVGMCYPSIDRRGPQSHIGDNNKSWGLYEEWLYNFSVRHDGKEILLPHQISTYKFRIYVDYEAGELSFFELCDPIRHLHTFTTTFTEPLHAVLWVVNGFLKISGAAETGKKGRI
ncbi:uncharacterized protein [Engystomops pustulosus]|uniref:uncharacterized protein n=1 Tax=Engystomops pustulosus TaxID=76066 RepID=UPI003AFB41A7